MVWRKYQARRSGECWIDITGEHRVRFEVGIVETGRSRVYEGVYLKVWGPDGQEWLGEDRWSLLRALHDVAGQIESAGGKMMCTGLDLRQGGRDRAPWSFREGTAHRRRTPMAAPVRREACEAKSMGQRLSAVVPLPAPWVLVLLRGIARGLRLSDHLLGG
jgi:hypothetical protein